MSTQWYHRPPGGFGVTSQIWTGPVFLTIDECFHHQPFVRAPLNHLPLWWNPPVNLLMSRPNKGLCTDKKPAPTSKQLHTGQLIHLIEALARKKIKEKKQIPCLRWLDGDGASIKSKEQKLSEVIHSHTCTRALVLLVIRRPLYKTIRVCSGQPELSCSQDFNLWWTWDQWCEKMRTKREAEEKHKQEV